MILAFWQNVKTMLKHAVCHVRVLICIRFPPFEKASFQGTKSLTQRQETPAGGMMTKERSWKRAECIYRGTWQECRSLWSVLGLNVSVKWIIIGLTSNRILLVILWFIATNLLCARNLSHRRAQLFMMLDTFTQQEKRRLISGKDSTFKGQLRGCLGPHCTSRNPQDWTTTQKTGYYVDILIYPYLICHPEVHRFDPFDSTKREEFVPPTRWGSDGSPPQREEATQLTCGCK